jgi:hypothetical protein
MSSFHEGFSTEPPKTSNFHLGFTLEAITGTGIALATPVPPTSTLIHDDSQNNYFSLVDNQGVGYGATGLMSMVEFQSSCYGIVKPGTVFLFPGTYANSPAYQGNLYLNCVAQQALNGNNGALHQQMCDLLGQPTTNFIGFSATYPWNASNGIGFNSGICNPNWFGDRTIPSDYNGVNWQALVTNAVAMLTTAYGTGVSSDQKLPDEDHRSGPDFFFLDGVDNLETLTVAFLTSGSDDPNNITANLKRDKSFSDPVIAAIKNGSTVKGSDLDSGDKYYIADPSGATLNFSVILSSRRG